MVDLNRIYKTIYSTYLSFLYRLGIPYKRLNEKWENKFNQEWKLNSNFAEEQQDLNKEIVDVVNKNFMDLL